MECEAKEPSGGDEKRKKERKAVALSYSFRGCYFYNHFLVKVGGWLTVLFQMYVGDYYKELIIKMI